MSFKVKCQSCENEIHKILDTLAFYQTITDGGILECEHCKARYKSKYKTSFFNGLVPLASSIFLVVFIIFIFNDYSFSFSFKQEPTKQETTPDIRTMYKRVTGMELPETRPNILPPNWEVIGDKLRTDIENKTKYGVFKPILSILCFFIVFNILNLTVIFFMPLRKINTSDELFWDVRQKD